MLDITLKYRAFRLTGVYAPNNHVEPFDLFQQIEPFLISKQIVLVGDWNVILKPDLNSIISSTNHWDVKPFCDFINKFDFVDMY